MKKSGFIAIAGRPNSGKSTLLNRVLGSKLSIVTPKAQTTRERVLGILTEKHGQIVFTDTPGIHRAKEGGINAYMMQEVREALEGASLVWYMVDPTSAVYHEMMVLELLRNIRLPVYLLFNKSDIVNTPERVRALEEFKAELTQTAGDMGIEIERVFTISALEGNDVDALMEASWEKLPTGEYHYPDEDQLSDRPTRFFVSEKIREQLLLQLGEEIPYSCAVEINQFNEESKPPRIEATIYVERDSQKGMVIGKGGTKIKSIGQAARKEVEEFLGGQVFLGLQVKVLKDWSRDFELLKRLGYNLPKSRLA